MNISNNLRELHRSRHRFAGLVLLLLIGIPASAMAEVTSLAKYDGDKDVTLLTQDLCTTIAGQGNQISSMSDMILTKYLKDKGIPSPTKTDKIKFLNRNKDKMVCSHNGQHYMKFALDMRKHRDVFDKLFIDTLDIGSDNLFVDVNAVSPASDNERVNILVKNPSAGQPETLLDYMDFIIATDKFGSAYLGEIKRLRAMLVEDFGAKKFSELPAKVQAEYRKKLK